ncbi:hypothetical protein L596_011367 [Steinernema carpocapsae]|uniref:SCP domain-containing protein n=1 Tax=Steinernema carpocapsae TaxID=34508 RepID=A0A4U5NTN1_STECR|nr:hypothetical protein L596_011367 [Steinernema carpocapsae]
MDPGFNIAEFRAKHLKDSNDYRRRHGAQPLVLDEELNKCAQEWAETLAKANEMNCKAGANPYGENIGAGHTPCANVVKMWYDEESKYNYEASKYNPDCGHFTQLVWRNSRRLGVGIAKSATGIYYIVANYDPPGNFVGQFLLNVGTKR